MRALALLIVLLAARVASAQPTSADKKAAKEAFQRAEAAEKRKDWRTAIDEYQQAYDIIPHADVLANIALDLERLEEYRDAATFYRRYLDESPDAADRDRVEKLIDKLRARPGILTITSDPTGAEVMLDGRSIGHTPIEQKASGAHEIQVSSDTGTASREVTIEFGEPQTVHVPIVARAGWLVVNSNVAGAQVTIDGTFAGVTPFSGEIPSGSHRVVVTLEGWSSYERGVDVPAEGSTQMTASLVRPVGWVAPLEEPKQPRAYFLLSGGADVTGESGGTYALMFGVHRGKAMFGLGYGFLKEHAAFTLEAKYAFTHGKLRPYIRVSTLLGSLSTVTAHVGAMYTVSAGARAQTNLFAEAGAGIVRLPNEVDSTVTDTLLYVPAIAGLQFSY